MRELIIEASSAQKWLTVVGPSLHLQPLSGKHQQSQFKDGHSDLLVWSAGRLPEFQTGSTDFADDVYALDGTVNDSLPGFRKLMEGND